jgi:hypothetical protein
VPVLEDGVGEEGDVNGARGVPWEKGKRKGFLAVDQG